MSSIKLIQIIRQINNIDLDKADYSYLVSLIRSASDKFSLRIMPIANKIYFRARICNSKNIDQVSELGAPTASQIGGFQRCNPPGVSMFYASSKRITTLLECDVKDGDIVYIGQWISKTLAPLNRVLTNPEDTESDVRTDTEHIFLTFIETLFTRQIHKTFSNSYKVTAAVTEVLTTGYPKKMSFIGRNNEEVIVETDGTGGLCYPSVTNISNSYNTVFHSSFTDTNFLLMHVTKLRVIKRTDKEFSVEIIDTANEIEAGKILWLNNNYSIPREPIEDKNGIILMTNGRNWVIPVRNNPLTAEDIKLFLYE